MLLGCSLTSSGFVPFGIINGDQVGPHAIDGVTDPINLDVPIVFNHKEQQTIYVSMQKLMQWSQSSLCDVDIHQWSDFICL